MARARVEAEAAHRWARYAADMGPDADDDDMPAVADNESDDEHVGNNQGPQEWRGWIPGDARRAGGDRRLPLPHFLRLMAGARMAERPVAAGTNDDLVAHLRRSGVLKHEPVARALRVCARDRFVPADHRNEALEDSPIRLHALDFNISAPHMHATCLEALKLQPGHRFLDVGSGCGVLTAAGAFLVGRAGASIGIDVKPCAVELGTSNLRRLITESAEFAAVAAPVAFHMHNVFLPSAQHTGKYDRVHVGASCPLDRLSALTSLLGPKGGLIVTPCGSDLRLISVAPGGEVTQTILSQVRYSDLEVPTDVEVVAAAVADARAQRSAPPPLPSTFAADCAAILGPSGGGCGSGGGGFQIASGRRASTDSDCSVGTPLGRGNGDGGGGRIGSGVSEEEGQEYHGGQAAGQAWVPSSVKRLGKLLTACSGSAQSSGAGAAGSPGAGSCGGASSLSSTCGMLVDDDPPRACDLGSGQEEAETIRAALDADALGPPDAVLAGSGWELPLHWAVLRQRCEHGRARAGSGWRDAGEPRVLAPDAAPQSAASAFVDFLYTDRLTADPADAQGLVDVLHLAIYFGAPRLAALAEAALAALLQQPPTPDFDPVEAAPALMALADDNGLPALAAAAADFCVHAHGQVAATPAYAALTKRQTDLITAEACAAVSRYQSALQSAARRELLPEPDPFPF